MATRCWAGNSSNFCVYLARREVMLFLHSNNRSHVTHYHSITESRDTLPHRPTAHLSRATQTTRVNHTSKYQPCLSATSQHYTAQPNSRTHFRQAYYGHFQAQWGLKASVKVCDLKSAITVLPEHKNPSDVVKLAQSCLRHSKHTTLKELSA
jgi:hypothetical protein